VIPPTGLRRSRSFFDHHNQSISVQMRKSWRKPSPSHTAKGVLARKRHVSETPASIVNSHGLPHDQNNLFIVGSSTLPTGG
jgi:hypothetical protein